MEKNILAEIETFRGIEPEADIGEALRQLVKEVMRRSKQVRLYVFAFNFIWKKPFLRFFILFCAAMQSDGSGKSGPLTCCVIQNGKFSLLGSRNLNLSNRVKSYSKRQIFFTHNCTLGNNHPHRQSNLSQLNPAQLALSF